MELICHTGCAVGADTYWEDLTIKYDGIVKGYSYKTKYHNSPNKIEITDEQSDEGFDYIKKANKILKRNNISKYKNLLSRNWYQVKYSKQVFGVGQIKEFNKYPIVDGGTAYAIIMGYQLQLPIIFFDQNLNKPFKWSYIIDRFIEEDIDNIKIEYANFTGIGTRSLEESGKGFIDYVFRNTFK